MKQANDNQIIIYNTEDGQAKLEVLLKDETLWLSQKHMAELFDCSTDNISLHLRNIFKQAELSENVVAEESSVTASDGKQYHVKQYNLDAIISVGYRINSLRGTQFRIWATQKLKGWIQKLDDFLALNEKEILDHAGTVSRKNMEERVRQELAAFNQKQLNYH